MWIPKSSPIVFSDLEGASDCGEGLLKPRMLGFLLRGGARKFAFLTNVQLVLMLLVWDHTLRTTVL